ncbi:MAG: ribokinase [Proteobacteria bacterium]|nr:ribokinase [Pseudomonadota bacterium]
MDRPVVVIGSLNMDLVVRVPRMPAAGETLTGDGYATAPGGKGANQAVAVARMGAPVAMVGCVGRDAHGAELRAGLEADGIDTTQVRAHDDAHSGVAVIVVEATGQNRIVLAPGANALLDAVAINFAGAMIERAALVVLQLEVPLPTVLHAAKRARRVGVPVLLNAAPAVALPDDLWQAIDILVVNESEAALLAGTDVVDADSAVRAAGALRERGPATVIVTLGALGVVLVDAHGVIVQPAHAVTAIDTTAAGDTFIGAYAAARREGWSNADALSLGQAASALCVTRRGAQPSIPYRHELTGDYTPRPAGVPQPFTQGSR